jgi:hypothetical protein
MTIILAITNVEFEVLTAMVVSSGINRQCSPLKSTDVPEDVDDSIFMVEG